MKKYQLGEFEEIVLLTVGILDGDAYGITIKDEIESRLKREVSVGALQVTLRRLESKGHLKSKMGETDKNRGGRPKLYFILTAAGKRALHHTRDTRDRLWNALPQLKFRLE
jgi:DNA-binding PadR family transcriptional regulator